MLVSLAGAADVCRGADEVGALLGCEAAPDAFGGIDVEGVLGAFALNWTGSADA